MKAIFLTFFLFILLFNIHTQVMAIDTDAQEEDNAVVRTIETINDLRDIYGIPSLSYNEALNKTAQTHNRYMEMNNIFSSLEESGNVYFRGRYPWDRTAFNNYNESYILELINQDVSNYSNGLLTLLENPYARYGILDPIYSDLGMNLYKGYATYIFGGSGRDGNYEAVYPYNNASNVSVKFDNEYTLDPYSTLGESSVSVGVPVTYSFYTPTASIKSFDNLKGTIRNLSNGEYVDLTLVTSLDDYNINNTIMLLPKYSYDYGTTYQVQIQGVLEFDRPVLIDGTYQTSKTVSITSTFRTATSSYAVNTQSYITRADFVEGMIQSSNFSIEESLQSIFTDVNVNSSDYKYIYTAYINGLINGYSDRSYHPEDNISREQAYTILVRAYEKQKGTITLTNGNRKLDFNDTDLISSYALESIYKAKKIGLLEDSSSKFSPGAYISKSEFEDILERYEEALDE